MTRICDYKRCRKTIHLGADHIELRFIGMKELEKLFGASELDFCSFECMAIFMASDERVEKEAKRG